MSIFLKNGMASLNISPSTYPALEKIVALSDKDYSDLIKALGETGAALTPEKCAENISKKVTSLKASDITIMVSVLIALYGAKDIGKDSSEFSDDIIAAISASPSSSNFGAEKLETLKRRIGELFLLEGNLQITSKALEIMVQHDRIFLEARILSDLRPIFTSSPEKAEAAVVIHNLQIRFRESGMVKSSYFALDNGDLKKLKDMIERAEKKTNALKAIAKASQLTYLEA